jgi:DNA-directed RNA polymerase specialized sigma24 family protein
LSEIADTAGCPENTVKTRLFHARRLLRTSGLLESVR